jgi:hypothetical protein
MKQTIIMIITLLALSCNPDRRSSEGNEQNMEQREPVAPAESDTSSIHTDTTTTGGMNRPNQYDTLK